MSSPQPYELYAIRYAHHERRASENFIGGDPHDVSMPLDYFIWVIRNDQRRSSSTPASTSTSRKSASARSCAIRQKV